MNNKIKEMLVFISQCYQQKDANNINMLAKLLFDEKDPPIIIGTSNSEWCLTLEQVKQIFLDDWDGWGNVIIDVDSVLINELDSLAWFKVNASVEYNFSDSEEKYQSYLDLVTRIAKSNKPSLVKMSEINWFLVHLLHNRNPETRKYLWDLTITGILEKVNDDLKFKLMQFAIPTTNLFPDVRIDIEHEDKDDFIKEINQLIEYNDNQINNQFINNSIIKLFNNDFIFNESNKNFFIDFDSKVYNIQEFNLYFSRFFNDNKIELNKDSIIIKQVNDKEFYFSGIGLINKKIELDNELNKVLNNIDYYNGLKDTKDALFKLRRDLALVLKESVVYKEHTAPFRFEGVGKINNDLISFNYLHLSYPFNWILEQKTDASKET